MGFQPKLPKLQWLHTFSDPEEKTIDIPSQRHKLAVCLYGDCVYLYGGASKSRTHTDLFRFRLDDRKWEKLQAKGECPPPLQGHTLLAYKNKLYVFGGNFSYGGVQWDVPLWIYELGSHTWRKHQAKQAEEMLPESRREHTAVRRSGRMYVYGGFIDLKGSTAELWTFDMDSECWSLAYNRKPSDGGPGSRHGHSALIHGAHLWVCGGMSDLQHRPELWRWHLGLRQWEKIKPKTPDPAENFSLTLHIWHPSPLFELPRSYPGMCQWEKIKPKTPGPAEMFGHTAVFVREYLIVYGAEQQTIWVFHTETCTWHRASCSGPFPPPRSHHAALAFHLTSSAQHHTDTLRQSSDNAYSIGSKNIPADFRHTISGRLGNVANGQLSNAISKRGSNSILPVSKISRDGQKQNDLSVAEMSFMNECVNPSNTTTEYFENAVESYKKFALELQRGCSTDSNHDDVNMAAKKRPYVRHSSGLNEAIQMKALNRLNCQMSSSCDSVAVQGCANKDEALLLKKRSRTFGDLSLDSKSAFENPAYLNSTGGSGDIAYAVSQHSIDNEATNSVSNGDLPDSHGLKYRRADTGKAHGPVTKSVALYKARRRNREINRCVSAESILETSPTHSAKEGASSPAENEDDLYTMNYKYDTFGKSLRSITLPGSTEELRQLVLNPGRGLNTNDLVIEELKECDLTDLISDQSFSKKHFPKRKPGASLGWSSFDDPLGQIDEKQKHGAIWEGVLSSTGGSSKVRTCIDTEEWAGDTESGNYRSFPLMTSQIENGGLRKQPRLNPEPDKAEEQDCGISLDKRALNSTKVYEYAGSLSRQKLNYYSVSFDNPDTNSDTRTVDSSVVYSNPVFEKSVSHESDFHDTSLNHARASLHTSEIYFSMRTADDTQELGNRNGNNTDTYTVHDEKLKRKEEQLQRQANVQLGTMSSSNVGTHRVHYGPPKQVTMLVFGGKEASTSFTVKPIALYELPIFF